MYKISSNFVTYAKSSSAIIPLSMVLYLIYSYRYIYPWILLKQPLEMVGIGFIMYSQEPKVVMTVSMLVSLSLCLSLFLPFSLSHFFFFPLFKGFHDLSDFFVSLLCLVDGCAEEKPLMQAHEKRR